MAVPIEELLRREVTYERLPESYAREPILPRPWEYVLSLLKDAITHYPVKYVTLKVTNFQLLENQQMPINTDEKASFHIEVWNRGDLDLTGVQLQITGSEWAYVGKAADERSESILSPLKTIPAHRTKKFGPFYMIPKSPTDVERRLFSARVNHFDASFDHMLKDHLAEGSRLAVFEEKILPG